MCGSESCTHEISVLLCVGVISVGMEARSPLTGLRSLLLCREKEGAMGVKMGEVVYRQGSLCEMFIH